MNIYLSGGGSTEQTKALDELYFGSIPSGSRIAYIPIALRHSRSIEDCANWFRHLLSENGDFTLSVLDDLTEQRSDLMNFDAVYIGGGNTYDLLQEVRNSGVEKYLKQFAESGKPIYGGSAGAVLLGKDIGTVARMDTNKGNISNTSGLNSTSGFSVWPHYNSSEDEHIFKYAAETSTPVLALSEDAGVHINATLNPVGVVWKFDSSGKNICV
ncbi:MAG: Type 1 glutamine amidotransferase-like domain-containing protein [Granulosicoccus sp.]